METNQKKYTITCGRNVASLRHPSRDLMSFVVGSINEVKAHAEAFIVVIPDELDSYKSEINAWKGDTTLEITHQDDDTFIFIAAPLHEGTHPGFDIFVEEYRCPDGDSDDEDEDDEEDGESSCEETEWTTLSRDRSDANLAFLSLLCCQ